MYFYRSKWCGGVSIWTNIGMWIRCFTQQIGCIAVKFQEMFLTTYFTGPHVLFTAECKDLLSGVQLCFLLFPLKGVYLVHKSSSNIYGEVTQRWSWRTRFSSCQLIMMTSPRGRHHEKKLLFFWISSKWGGGWPAQIFPHLFISAFLVNNRSIFPPKCQ